MNVSDKSAVVAVLAAFGVDTDVNNDLLASAGCGIDSSTLATATTTAANRFRQRLYASDSPGKLLLADFLENTKASRFPW